MLQNLAIVTVVKGAGVQTTMGFKTQMAARPATPCPFSCLSRSGEGLTSAFLTQLLLTLGLLFWGPHFKTSSAPPSTQ